MDGQNAPPADTARIRSLAEKAARVQDVLQDLEVALLRSGDKSGLRLVGDLKRTWRNFRDEALGSPPRDQAPVPGRESAGDTPTAADGPRC